MNVFSRMTARLKTRKLLRPRRSWSDRILKQESHISGCPSREHGDEAKTRETRRAVIANQPTWPVPPTHAQSEKAQKTPPPLRASSLVNPNNSDYCPKFSRPSTRNQKSLSTSIRFFRCICFHLRREREGAAEFPHTGDGVQVYTGKN